MKLMSNKKGFSLIELVLALLLFAIAGTVGSMMFVQAGSTSLDNKDRVTAMKLAEQTLDELVSTKAFAGLAALRQEHMVDAAAFPAPYNNFRKRVSVYSVNPGNISGDVEDPVVYLDPTAGEGEAAWDDLVKVDIVVSWNNGGNDTVNLSTVLSQHDRD